MSEPNDDEDDISQSLYEDGHWDWDENNQALIFISHAPVKENILDYVPAVFGPIQFRDDLDVVEQLRFRKRYQRKLGGDSDVILLQDIKDVVLYTAPTSIMLPSVVKILHLSTTERFLRGLILYSQYFLQITDEMTRRIEEQETKVRSNKSIEIEMLFRDNLEDLRLLIAKEYSTMLIGGADFFKYHHMGPLKKTRSLSNKEACQFESVLRLCIQIVWIALGRKSLQLIECEIHRIFKSEIFNNIEHKSHFEPALKMNAQKKAILQGHCVHKQTKPSTQSPLIKEIFCHRTIDFRLLSLGTIQHSNLSQRQKYLEAVLTARESSFRQLQVTLGIVGLPRVRFDTLLREINVVTGNSSSCATRGRMSRPSIKKPTPSMSKSRGSVPKSRHSMAKSTTSMIARTYPQIMIPPKWKEKEWQPEEFPYQAFPSNPCSRLQRRKWLARAVRLHDRRSTKKSKAFAY